MTVRHGIVEQEWAYIDYHANAHDIRARDYDQLRGFLKWNVEKHRDDHVLRLQVARSMLGKRKIDLVWDVGAGHGAWSSILAAAFPDAIVAMLDRFPIETSEERIVAREGDALQVIAETAPDPGSLFFMSEWVHCKEANLKILSHQTLAASPIIVVELDPTEAPIEARLRQVGGRLLSADELFAAMPNHVPINGSRFEATFRYHLHAMMPKAWAAK